MIDGRKICLFSVAAAALSACSTAPLTTNPTNLVYDYAQACQLQESLYAHLGPAYWDNIVHHRFIVKQEVVDAPNAPSGKAVEYTYAHDGLYLEFNKKDAKSTRREDYNIDLLRLSSARLPKDLVTRSDVASKLSVSEQSEFKDIWSIGCEMTELIISFDGDRIKQIELSSPTD